MVPLLDVDNTVEALTAQLQDMGSGALYCPHAAHGVVSCTFQQQMKGTKGSKIVKGSNHTSAADPDEDA